MYLPDQSDEEIMSLRKIVANLTSVDISTLYPYDIDQLCQMWNQAIYA